MNALPLDEVHPKPLVTGEDLIAAGYFPGPLFKEILTTVEDAQLDGSLKSTEEAMRLVRREFPVNANVPS